MPKSGPRAIVVAVFDHAMAARRTVVTRRPGDKWTVSTVLSTTRVLADHAWALGVVELKCTRLPKAWKKSAVFLTAPANKHGLHANEETENCI